jgi:tRNA dimethylallyltransferase
MSSFRRGQRDPSPPYRFHALALIPSDRSRLHQRIETRFDTMLRAGLVDEVSGLRNKYDLTPKLPSMRCVGYRQVWEYLEGQYDAQELRNRGIYATRQLAKRQLTWLRGMQPETVDCFDDGVSTRVKNWVDRALES